MKTKRYNGEGDSKVDAMEEANKGESLDSTPGPVAKRTPMRKTPIVTKEQLGDMELRDYLNKQRGLTRRGESSSGRKPSVSQATLNSAKSQEIIDRMAKRTRPYLTDEVGNNLKRGGAVKKMASGGSVSSASSRGDGIAQKGKTRGKMC